MSLFLLLSVFVFQGADSTWVPIGSAPILFGQSENVPNRDPVVGAVHVLLPHPGNADILWIGTVNGGVWKTSNATATEPAWSSLTDVSSSLSIGAMTFDYNDNTYQTVLVGLGRFSSFGYGGSNNGLLLTEDGGATFTALGESAFSGSRIRGLSMSGSVITVGAEAGMYRSEDKGLNFDLLSGDGGSGLPAGIVLDLVEDPTNRQRLFATVQTASSTTSGVYYSADGGETWTLVSTGTLNSQMFSASNGELAIGQANNVFVAVAVGGQLAGLYSTPDGGTNWSSNDLPSPTIHPGFQAGIHMSIAADPSNNQIFYVGGDRQDLLGGGWPNAIGASDFSGNLYRINSGAAPGSQAEHLTHTPVGGVGGTTDSSSPHADSRDMAFDAAGNLLEVDDGGVFKRTQPQSNEGGWVSLNGTLQITEYHNIAYDSVSNIVIGGAQDVGTSEQWAEGSEIWYSWFTADGGDVAVDTQTVPGSSVRYRSFQNLGSFNRITFDANNGFVNIVFISLTLLGGSPLSPNFVNPVVLNSAQPQRLILYAGNGLYESMDQGDTITQVMPSARIGVFGTSPLVYGAQDNADVVYVGSNDTLHTRQDATTFAELLNFPARGGGVDVVAVDLNRNRSADVFAATLSNVYFSDDSGQSWTTITGDLGALSPGSILSMDYLENAKGDDWIIVGTTRGMFGAPSTGNFSNWVVFGNGLPRTFVMDMDYSAEDDVLVAGLLGRGAWQICGLFGGASCESDLNEDSNTDQQDLSALAPFWTSAKNDLTGDNFNNILDYVHVVNNYGPCGCPTNRPDTSE